jgi:uncharacterized membrane protein YfcA
MMIILFVVAFLRGTGKKPSVIGVTKCDTVDHTLFILLIVSGLIVTIISVVILKKEYNYKVKVGYKFTPGDFECTTKNSFKLPLIAFTGGLIAGGLGIGAGLIFNPIMIQLGIHPTVASATGMYMVMYTTMASTMVVILLNKLYVQYAVILCVLTLIGTIPGVYC